MTIKLNPFSVRPGDVILVFSQGKRANLNLAGQTVLRLRSILFGDSHRARYSHVMLGISPGVVIHSDGDTVKVQPLTDAFKRDRIERDCFRVLRLITPPLEDGTGMKIVTEAQLFLKQKYSFIPGRRSSMIGRILHGKRQLTHPFCSELVAATYKAIGRPICSRPPDRTLPVDLEVHCVSPSWEDVSEEYVAEPLPPAHVGDPIQVGDRQLTLPEFFQETDRLLDKMYGHNAEQANLTHDVVKSIVAPCVLVQQLKSAELELSKYLALKPQLLFDSYRAVTLGDLSSLGTFYEQIPLGIQTETTPFADAMQQALPNVESGRKAYESLPTVDTLRHLELLGASLAFGAKALRLESELLGIAIGLGMPIADKGRFVDISKELVAPFVSEIPRLVKDKADRLAQSIDELSMPDSEKYTVDVRRRCRNVVRVHQWLSILCFDVSKALPLA